MGRVQSKSVEHKSKHKSNEGRHDLSDDAYSAFSEIPDEILYEVFLRLHASDLKTCFLVCKRCAGLLSCQGFWKQKCQQVFSKKLLQFLKHEEDYRKLYFKRPYERNLIKNCDASQGMQHWSLDRNEAHGWPHEYNPWAIEKLIKFAPIVVNSITSSEKKTRGLENIADFDEAQWEIRKLTKLAAPDVPLGFWVTKKMKYGSCCKSQIIDLLEEGCSEYILDVIRPSILISEWYSTLEGGEEKYTLKVILMKAKEEMWNNSTPEDCVYIFSDELLGMRWFKAEHVFKKYPAGVRYIGFLHQAELFEAEYDVLLGVRITLSKVVFDFSHTKLMESEPGKEPPVSSSLN